MEIAQFYMCISFTNLEENKGRHMTTLTHIASVMDLRYLDQGYSMKLCVHNFEAPFYDSFIN